MLANFDTHATIFAAIANQKPSSVPFESWPHLAEAEPHAVELGPLVFESGPDSVDSRSCLGRTCAIPGRKNAHDPIRRHPRIDRRRACVGSSPSANCPAVCSCWGHASITALLRALKRPVVGSAGGRPEVWRGGGSLGRVLRNQKTDVEGPGAPRSVVSRNPWRGKSNSRP